MSDMNLVTRMDSYFTNFNMPWEKKAKKELKDETVSTVGALQHFKIECNGKTKENCWVSTPTWAKTYGT